MTTLKKVLIVVLVLIAIPLIAAIFLPNEFRSEREIVINKPQDQVFDYIKQVKNQDNFGVWQLSDPNMKKSYEGIDGTVGFKYTWDSEKLGKGSQKIINISEPSRVETELDFGFGDPAIGYFVTEPLSSDQTRVTWGISGTSPYPFNLISCFIDMGKDFDIGLANLKNVLEK